MKIKNTKVAYKGVTPPKVPPSGVPNLWDVDRSRATLLKNRFGKKWRTDVLAYLGR